MRNVLVDATRRRWRNRNGRSKQRFGRPSFKEGKGRAGKWPQRNHSWRHATPPPPCIVITLAYQVGLRGNRHFPFANLLRRSDIFCVFAGWTRWYYWCIAVCCRFLVSKALHCTLYHAEHFSFSHFQPSMLIILTRTPQLPISNVLSTVPAKILGPSERGADYRSITHERSGSVVTHDCAPYSTDVRHLCANTPTTHPSSLSRPLVREKAHWEVQLKLYAFLTVRHPLPPMRQTPCSSLW